MCTKGEIGQFGRPEPSTFVTETKRKAVKLAASIAMNPHYHPYSDLSAQHPPSPDNNNGFPPLSGGGGGGGMSVNIGHHPNHHMSHHLHNGHNNSSQNNGPNGGPMPMDGQQTFQHMNNNVGPMKHCAGCGGKAQDILFCW